MNVHQGLSLNMMSGINAIGRWFRISCMAAGILFLFAGCREPLRDPDYDWYERTRSVTREREVFVEEQEELGVSEAEAKRMFDAQRVIERTRGEPREEEWSAEELFDVVDPP
jgi:hypothetical protein